MLVLAVIGTMSAFAKTPVSIAVEGKSVAAHVSTGANTAWFSISKESTGNADRLIHRAFLMKDDDRDGVVQVTLSHPPVPTSLWMVVDLESGEYSIVAPPGAPLRRRAMPPSALVSRGNSKSARLLQQELLTIFFVARPGVGAWIARVEDGSPADGDLTPDGKATVMLEKMTPVGDSPPAPNDLQHDDIVAFANPLTLAVYDVRVVK
jgi:hypothetical protein